MRFKSRNRMGGTLSTNGFPIAIIAPASQYKAHCYGNNELKSARCWVFSNDRNYLKALAGWLYGMMCFLRKYFDAFVNSSSGFKYW